jgi:hypothetical protein
MLSFGMDFIQASEQLITPDDVADSAQQERAELVVRDAAGYPLRPVVTIPSTKYFCATKNSSTGGSNATKDMAAI